MRRFIILTTIFFLSYILLSCKFKDNLIINKNQLYTVYKIDSINSYYLLYLRKKNKKFKVISSKTTNKKCRKTAIGDKIDVALESILDRKIKLGEGTITSSNNALVNCFYFEGNTKICKEEEEGIYDLFVTKNLNGLCLNSNSSE